jgi:carbon-monoxide dehydrogenase large subunit
MSGGPLSFLDRPNSYIGRSVPRPNARRLLEGRGTYVDDLRLPRLVHAAFLRSPYAHARIRAIDTEAAARLPGVVRVATAADLAGRYAPWVGVLTHMKGLKSPPQHPLAVERACWQGEPVAAVVAESRAQAEDAVAAITVQWEELPPVADMEAALAPGAPTRPSPAPMPSSRRGWRWAATPASVPRPARSSPTSTAPRGRSRSTTRPRRRT